MSSKTEHGRMQFDSLKTNVVYMYSIVTSQILRMILKKNISENNSARPRIRVT